VLVCFSEAGHSLTGDASHMDQMSSSGSSSHSAYIDIDMIDDVHIDSMVIAGIMPTVSKPLKQEISLYWQSLERTRSSMLHTFCQSHSCFVFL